MCTGKPESESASGMSRWVTDMLEFAAMPQRITHPSAGMSPTQQPGSVRAHCAQATNQTTKKATAVKFLRSEPPVGNCRVSHYLQYTGI